MNDWKAAVRFDHIAGIELMLWRIGERDVELARLSKDEAVRVAADLLHWATLQDGRKRE